MSGGRYHYAFLKEGPDLFSDQYIASLEAIEADLRGYGKTEAAYMISRYIKSLYAARAKAQRQANDLKDLLHAVEWWQSHDTSESDFDKVFEKLKLEMLLGMKDFLP